MDTGLDPPRDEDWRALPAVSFYYIMNKECKKDSDLTKILNLNRKVKNDLLKFKVIDLVVHHRNHFSRMFILNAGMIVDGLWKFH